jgi:hypothetical protein
MNGQLQLTGVFTSLTFLKEQLLSSLHAVASQINWVIIARNRTA